MSKHNFSPAGVLLGLILGPIAEDGLRDMLVVSHGSPFSFVLFRPISMAILICICLALYFSMKPKPWEDEDRESEEDRESADPGGRQRIDD
jgi:putative tricarboxylic transport membrane protein